MGILGTLHLKKPASYANEVWLMLIFQKHYEAYNRHVVKC